MTHKSQKPIKYYFFKKDISWFNCTENHAKRDSNIFLFSATFTPHHLYLLTAQMKNSWCSLSVKVMLFRIQEGSTFLRTTHSVVLTQVRKKLIKMTSKKQIHSKNHKLYFKRNDPPLFEMAHTTLGNNQ